MTCSEIPTGDCTNFNGGCEDTCITTIGSNSYTLGAPQFMCVSWSCGALVCAGAGGS